MRFAFLVPAAALMLAGCGSDDFTCSSKTVLETLGDIARKQLAKDPTMVIFEKDVSFRVDDIRQQGGNDRAISCAANLTITGLRPVAQAVNDPMTGAPWTKERLSNLLTGTGMEATDITYKVEKLDKGGFYVTVKGL
ncbi:hypothetical protein SG09_38070 [Bradyrhizobium ottawaense]|uniref:hypothetical protein n=1 Tax=Bradyrhizobium ottawaense TaxID=931866 RepID=UPI001260E278|nr:hypothetical protein [Bradyrhizobium ottawaense]BBO04457.1 hypothetical protein SG09_38070 [Bradyrhizobium ottawaense]